MTVLGISLAVSVIGGLITGIIINIPFLTRYVSSFSFTTITIRVSHFTLFFN